MIGAGLALALTIVFFLIKILFALARAYVLLLIYLIFAPVFILYGVAGGKGIYAGWLKGILANLLVFPAVGIIIFIAKTLRELTTRNIWGPPYIGSNEKIIDAAIVLGTIMIISAIPDIINQLLETRPLAPQIPAEGIAKQVTDIAKRAIPREH